MKVFFLRHAEAEDAAASDFERRLTSTGRQQARRVGTFCLRNEFVPEIILTSPLVRAEQTAQIVAQVLPGCEVVTERWLASGMSGSRFFEGIVAYRMHGSVMVVGHEPDFSEAISAAVGSASLAAVRVRKASVTLVDFGALRPGNGWVDWSLPVRLMGQEE